MKELPQNLDAERSVLGAVLLDSASLSAVVPILSLTIWVPIAFGIAVLAIGDDRNPAPARWTAPGSTTGTW